MITLMPPNKALTKTIYDGSSPHSHVLWEVVFFVEGDCLHHIMGKTYKCINGDVFIVGPQHVHNIELLQDNHRHCDLYISDEDFKNICSQFNIDNFYEQINKEIVHIHLSNSTLEHILTELKVIEVHNILAKNTPNDPIYKQCASIANSILHFLLGTYALKNIEHTSSPLPQWLLDLLYNLNRPEFFTKKPVELIKNSGYSHSRFSELFKEHLGTSLVEYMINKRMSYAGDLLVTTSKSTLEISSIVGYDSYSCFVRLFKKHFKMSPIQYRQYNLQH